MARSASIWQDIVNAAPTLPRELRAIAEYELDAARFADIATPILVLSGGERPSFYKDATEAVNDALYEIARREEGFNKAEAIPGEDTEIRTVPTGHVELSTSEQVHGVMAPSR